MKQAFLKDDWCGLKWSPFIPMEEWQPKLLPAAAGLYRVKVVGQPILAYIGQTGLSLRARLSSLRREAMKAEMPFNDPHTAAPRLWSYHDAHGCAYEVSAATVTGSKSHLMANECFLLWQYRTEARTSTLCNYGRMHPNYKSPKNTSTGIRGRRMRFSTECKLTDIGMPVFAAIQKPDTNGWMGFNWISNASSFPALQGVYLLCDLSEEIIYIGQTKNIKYRLRTHLNTEWGRQIRAVYCHLPECDTACKLLEYECDLIGHYFECHQRPPRLQFGDRDRTTL